MGVEEGVALRPAVRTVAAVAPVFAPATELGAGAGGATVPAAGAFDFKRWVTESLRGRYLLTIGLGVVCAGLFGAAGWRLAKPIYHSEGLVRIAYTMPEVMQETDQNRPLAMFETFMLSQRLLITSRRVIDMAIQDPIWKATGRTVPVAPDKYFAEHLKVDIRPRSEFIQITVQDNDPGTAAAAVTAVINSYQELYNAQDRQMDHQRLGVLEDQQNALQTKIESLRNRLRTGAQQYGTTKLDTFYEAAAAQLTKLDAALADVRLALATAPATTSVVAATQPAAAPTGSPAGPLPDVSLADQIAAYDVQLRVALDDEGKRKERLQQLLLGGLGANHPTVLAAKADVESARERVRARLTFQQEFRAAAGRYMGEPTAPAGGVTGGGAGGAAAGKTAAQLKVDEASLLRLREQTQKDMVALGNQQMDLKRVEDDLGSATAEYQQLSKRMESLRREGSLGGRLTIITSGEIPLSPDSDPRIKVGGAGALFGLCLPAGCFMLLGLTRRQYRYSKDTEGDIMPELPFLGVLPELAESDPLGDHSLAAAHAVHQIRVSIQSQMRNSGAGTYAITSATAGEGKTGLTMALGLSFAAAGMRTLVVDCDMIGRHMTSRLGVKGSGGLREAIEAGSAENLYRRVGDRLSVLAVGAGTAADAYAISGKRIRPILDEARREFDVVIVDTGPILGSVEAAVVAQEVDGVILAIARGRDRAMVRTAMRRLYTLGARSVGFVFNRAATTDFERSPYSSTSVRSISSKSDLATLGGKKAAAEGGAQLKDFGPLVRAVASGVPEHTN
jgi:Mrp family chromosome partitioning ATPase/uncharacterized protein involved in exopolysaccharide biosynthesis